MFHFLAAQTTNHQVTFRLDMSQYQGAPFTSAYLNSSLNAWCGSCQAMSDSDQDQIWELSIAIPTGIIEYKFTLDGWTAEETLIDPFSECTRTTGQYTNRKILVSQDTVLPLVCWESCYDCSVPFPPERNICEPCEDPMYFSGHHWDIKEYESYPAGPGNNFFSARASDVFVDSSGFMHMRLAEHNGKWYSTEVISEEEMGYGIYTFVIEGDLEQLPENSVIGLFTWDDSSYFSQCNSEIDVEIARWGDPTLPDPLLYSVQPVWSAGHFPERSHMVNTLPGKLNGITAHRIIWTDSLITWMSWERFADSPNMLGSWTFDLNNPPRRKDENGQVSDYIIIPAPGPDTHTHFNFWMLNGGPPSDGQEHEIIIRNFSYEPY